MKLKAKTAKKPSTRKAAPGGWASDGEAFRQQVPVVVTELPVLIMPLNRRPLLSKMAKALNRKYVTLPVSETEMAVLSFTLD